MPEFCEAKYPVSELVFTEKIPDISPKGEIPGCFYDELQPSKTLRTQNSHLHF